MLRGETVPSMRGEDGDTRVAAWLAEADTGGPTLAERGMPEAYLKRRPGEGEKLVGWEKKTEFIPSRWDAESSKSCSISKIKIKKEQREWVSVKRGWKRTTQAKYRCSGGGVSARSSLLLNWIKSKSFT